MWVFCFCYNHEFGGLHDKCKPMLVISVKAFVCEIHLVLAFSQLKILKNVYDICHWVAPALITFSYLGLVLSLQPYWKNKKLYFVAKLLTLLRQNVIQWHQVHCTFGDLYVYLKKIQMFFPAVTKNIMLAFFLIHGEIIDISEISVCLSVFIPVRYMWCQGDNVIGIIIWKNIYFENPCWMKLCIESTTNRQKTNKQKTDTEHLGYFALD